MLGETSFLRSWLRHAQATLVLIIGMTVSAAPPTWWSQPDATGHTVINSAVTDPSPKGPANIGQVKFMAKRALEAIHACDPALALEIHEKLTIPQPKPLHPSELIPAILDFDVPASPLPDDWHERQHAPLLVGQLKAIAAPFYDRLHVASPTWLDHESPEPAEQGQLQLNATKDQADPANFYPWSSDSGNDQSQSVATIGQLKAVFSLRFETLGATLDRDYDDDGLTNADEASRQTDPHNPDTDGDGMNDAWEVQWGLDPLNKSDASADHDGDNLSNLMESKVGTSPAGIYLIEVLPLGTSKYFHSAADDGSVIVRQSPSWTPESPLELVTAPDSSGNRTVVPLPPSNWMPLDTIVAGLVANGTLQDGDYLNPSGPESSDGSYRIFQTNTGSLILREPGYHASSLPPEAPWQAINNNGNAATVTERHVPSADGIPDHLEADLRIFNGYSSSIDPMPTAWFPAPEIPMIKALSNDRVLVRRQSQSPDGSSFYEICLLNASPRTFTSVRLPGLGGESIVSLSSMNGRMLGNGPKPFQITPDGTPSLLGALQIKTSQSAQAAPLDTIYPNALSPNHITSDGRITLTTTDASNRATILQLVPANDADCDGMMDDWEKLFAKMLLDFQNSPAAWGTLYSDLTSGDLNPAIDYTGDGITAAEIAQLFNRPPSLQSVDGIELQSQSRRNMLAWAMQIPASNGNPARYEGIFYYENSGYYGAGIEITNSAQLQPQYMETRLLSNPWEASVTQVGTSHFAIGPPNESHPYTEYSGEYRQTRIRLVAKTPSPLARSRSYLKVTLRPPYASASATSPEIMDVITVNPAIPAGRLTSEWIELIPPLVAGYEYTVSLVSPSVAADANCDGTITFDGLDATTESAPYAFWVNDDRDMGNKVDIYDWEEDDVLGNTSEYPSDNLEPGLKCRRDLEDITRVWIDLSGLGTAFNTYDANITMYARMEPTEGNPEVTLFQPVEYDGGRKYLTDEDVGYNQVNTFHGEELCTAVDTPEGSKVPDQAWRDLPYDRVIHLLFEGKWPGNGRLVFEFRRGSQVLLTLPPIYIALKEAKDMYETWTVGDVEFAGVQYNKTWPAATATITNGENLPPPTTDTGKDYILFVHGWNLDPWEKDSLFANTMFKRLWHLGFKGRYGAFRWPTFHGFPAPCIGLMDHFNGSEERAWNSAAALKQLITDRAKVFNIGGLSKVRLYGHSMGNIVCSEALRQFGSVAPVHTYVAAQAALSAHSWDPSTPIMTACGIPVAPSTPDIYAYFWHKGSSQYSVGKWQASGNPSYLSAIHMPSNVRYINHYNARDWALKNWEANTRMKPSQPKYSYVNSNTSFLKSDGILTSHYQTFPDERFEVFSWAAQSHSYATGAEGATGGNLGSSPAVDLDQAPFKFGSEHKGHSGQFRSTIQKRWRYWVQFAADMEIQNNAN